MTLWILTSFILELSKLGFPQESKRHMKINVTKQNSCTHLTGLFNSISFNGTSVHFLRQKPSSCSFSMMHNQSNPSVIFAESNSEICYWLSFFDALYQLYFFTQIHIYLYWATEIALHLDFWHVSPHIFHFSTVLRNQSDYVILLLKPSTLCIYVKIKQYPYTICILSSYYSFCYHMFSLISTFCFKRNYNLIKVQQN